MTGRTTASHARDVLQDVRQWGQKLLPQRTRRLLEINQRPHPYWLNVLPNELTHLSKGGIIWLAGALGAWALGVPRSGQALRELLPSLLVAGLAVRYPLKTLCGHPRPPQAAVRARLLGRQYRPGFPSGDATCAFAGAWVLSTVWPRGAALFLGLATGLSALRVYIGAHYPSDVAAGAVVGVGLAELVRRGVRLVGLIRPEHP